MSSAKASNIFLSCVVVVSFMAEVLALDIATMKRLIQDNLDAHRPFTTASFVSLWADDPNVELCFVDGCVKGKDGIKDACEEFLGIGPMTVDCEVGEDYSNCRFIEELNKAACSYSCSAVLLENPSCTSDSIDSISLYEWNDDGLLTHYLDFFADEDMVRALAPCKNDTNVLGAPRSQTSNKNDHYFYYLSFAVVALIAAVLFGVNKSKKGYAKIKSSNDHTHLLVA